MRLKNYSGSITKTRNVLKANAAKYEDTKQNIEIKLLGVVAWAAPHTGITCYETIPVTHALFVFSIFRAFVIILFFFVCWMLGRVTAQVPKFGAKSAIVWGNEHFQRALRAFNAIFVLNPERWTCERLRMFLLQRRRLWMSTKKNMGRLVGVN